MAHTQGPWAWDDYNDLVSLSEKRDFPCRREDGTLVDGKRVLTVYEGVYLSANDDDRTLIASAPDLLALLEEVVSAPPEGWSIKEAHDLHNRCKKVIAKAKGQG